MSAPAATETPANGAAPEEKPKGGSPMLPIILVIVLVPVLCYGMTNFLLLPKIKAMVHGAEVAEADSHGEAKEEAGHGHGEKKAEKKPEKKKEEKKGGHGGGHGGGEEANFEFGTTIVNLAGAGGARYLRTNFVVTGDDKNFPEVMKSNLSALRDTAINVLSSQSLSILDAPGGKNVVRNELISQFNRTLGGEVVEQIYFSEFVVQ